MKKLIAFILCVIMLLTTTACSRCKAGPGYKEGTYNGSLKSLVNNDYDELERFIKKGKFADSKDIVTVNCKDYVLTRGVGADGSADIFSGVFYEEGLIEYSKDTTDGYYDRFREDYVFAISSVKGNDDYWFMTYDDAIQWLEENF